MGLFGVFISAGNIFVCSLFLQLARISSTWLNPCLLVGFACERDFPKNRKALLWKFSHPKSSRAVNKVFWHGIQNQQRCECMQKRHDEFTLQWNFNEILRADAASKNCLHMWTEEAENMLKISYHLFVWFIGADLT